MRGLSERLNSWWRARTVRETRLLAVMMVLLAWIVISIIVVASSSSVLMIASLRVSFMLPMVSAAVVVMPAFVAITIPVVRSRGIRLLPAPQFFAEPRFFILIAAASVKILAATKLIDLQSG